MRIFLDPVPTGSEVTKLEDPVNLMNPLFNES